jgi:hypothetical protein
VVIGQLPFATLRFGGRRCAFPPYEIQAMHGTAFPCKPTPPSP